VVGFLYNRDSQHREAIPFIPAANGPEVQRCLAAMPDFCSSWALAEKERDYDEC